MIKDFLDSVSDYAKNRLTNPFFGTLLCVLILRNFEFLFAIFNFADGVTLTQKVDYIREYFSVHGSWRELISNILISFSVLAISFIFLLITRFFTNVYSAVLSWLNSKTAKLTMVELSVHQSLYEDYQKIKEKYEKLKVEEANFNKIIGDLNEQLVISKSNENTIKNDLVDLSSKKQELEVGFSSIKKENDELVMQNNDLQSDRADKFRLATIFMINKAKLNLNKSSLTAYIDSYLINTTSLKLEIRRDLKDTILSLVDNNLWRQVILINLIYDMKMPIGGSILSSYGHDLINLNILLSKQTHPVATNDSLYYRDLTISSLGIHSMSVLHGFYFEHVLRKKEIDEMNFDIQ